MLEPTGPPPPLEGVVGAALRLDALPAAALDGRADRDRGGRSIHSRDPGGKSVALVAPGPREDH